MNHIAEHFYADRAKHLSLLGTSAEPTGPYQLKINGEIPKNLRGTLFRNGPGLFDRDGVKKKHLLDGDGFIQAVSINEQSATYRSRFVQTEKYKAEEKAQRFLYPTWSTLAPKTLTKNLGARLLPQAGVTVVKRGDSLVAFDDTGHPYELDWKTLETRRNLKGDNNYPLPSYNAHNFFDSKSKQWIQFGMSYGRVNKIHLSISKPDGSPDKQYDFPVDFSTYMHDFFVTENYVVFLVPALRFNPLKMLAGVSSFIDAFTWLPERANQLWVISRKTGELVSKIETEASFMWHSLNAFDRGDEIVADFVGYDEPDHFIGSDAEFHTMMKAQPGVASSPGTVRRYVINPKTQRINTTVVSEGYHEFPMINPSYYCREHSVGYFSKGSGAGTNLHNGLAKIDMESGAGQEYFYAEHTHVGEPIFVADKEHPQDENRGWLISQFLDGEQGKSGFAIFSASRLGDGPVAELMMETHSPLSFHGWWTSEVA